MSKVYRNQLGKKKYNYSCIITIGGETRRVGLGFNDKDLAYRFKMEFNRLEAQSRLNPKESDYYWNEFYKLIGKPHLFRDIKNELNPKFVKGFNQMTDMKLKRGEITERTKATYLNTIKPLMKVIKQIRIRDFNQDHYDKFEALLYDEGYKPASISIKQRVLKCYLNWCIDRKYLDVMPVKITNVKPPKRLPRFLYPNQFNEVCSNAKNRLLVVYFYFLRETGMRRSEIQSCEEIERGNGLWLRIIGKGNKERFIPISEHLKPYWDIVKQGDYSPNTLTKEFGHICKKIGLKRTLHDLRHTFAFTQIAKGTPIFELKNEMGHSNIETTQIYLGVSPDMIMDLKDNPQMLVDQWNINPKEILAEQRVLN